MRVVITLVLLVAAFAASADDWVIVPDTSFSSRLLTRLGVTYSPTTSVDRHSIEPLDSGIRRAKVKLDFSSYRPGPTESAQKTLRLWVLVELYDCAKRASQMEASEAHLADGTVKLTKATNKSVWLQTEDDPILAFVCAWKPNAAPP